MLTVIRRILSYTKPCRKELLGMNVLEQVQIDRKLVELDGTDNLSLIHI